MLGVDFVVLCALRLRGPVEQFSTVMVSVANQNILILPQNESLFIEQKLCGLYLSLCFLYMLMQEYVNVL